MKITGSCLPLTLPGSAPGTAHSARYVLLVTVLVQFVAQHLAENGRSAEATATRLGYLAGGSMPRWSKAASVA